MVVLIPLVVAGLVGGGLYLWGVIESGHGAASTYTYDDQVEAAEEAFREIDATEQNRADELLSQADTPEDRANAYIALANSWSKVDNKKALEYAQKAVEEHESVDAYMALITFADIAGEDELAEEASQRAGELGAWTNEVE